MRKLKLFLSLLMLFTFSVGTWADSVKDTITIQNFAGLTTNGYVTTATDGETSKGVDAVLNNWNPKNGQIRVNQGSTSALGTGNFIAYNKDAFPGAITKVELVLKSGSVTNNYCQIATSSTAAITSNQTYNTANAASGSGTTKSWDLDKKDDIRYFRIGFAKNGGSIYATYIIITYEAASVEPTVSAVQGETDVVADGLSFTAKQNVAVTPQTFTLTGANLTEGLTLTSSSEAFVVSPTSLTKAEAEAGATITVTPATPTEATSPVQGTLTISGEEGLDDTEIALSMTVTPTYSITVPAITGGTLTWNPAKPDYAAQGEQFTLTATPNSGYTDGSIAIKNADNEDADITTTVLSGSTLTMPNNNIKVIVTFTQQSCTPLAAPSNVQITGTTYPYDNVAISWGAVEHADKYDITIKQGSDEVESASDLTTTSYSLTETLAANTTYTYEIVAKSNTPDDYCSNTVSANFATSDYPAATLTLSENGVESAFEGEHKLNDVVTLPTTATAIEDMTLAGWSTVTVATTDTKPSGDTFFEPGASFTLESTTQTLYAVYVEGHGAIDSWDLATSVTAGDVIVFATTPDNSTRKVNSSLGSQTYMSAVDASFSEDKQHLTALPIGAFPYTIGGNATNGWTLANGGQYLYISGDKKIALQDDATTWGLEFINDSARFTQDYKSSTYRMQYNYGNARFNVYTSNQQPVSIYKHVQEEANWHGYTTSFATKYTITIADDIQNGTVSADLAKASAGTTVTLTFTPAAHYRLSGWTLNGTAQDIAENTFAMPANDVVVSATFAEIKNAVNFDAPVGGTLVVKHNDVAITSGDEIQEGETLKLVYAASTEDHYIGGVVAVKDADNADVEVAADSTFVMPGKAVTVAATFTPTYAITAASVTGGSFSWEDDQSNANPAYVAAGTLIQAAADNATGYTFEAFDIYKTGEATTKVDHNDGLFEMPAYAVTIGGSFTENKIPEITLSQTEDYLFDDVAKGGSTSMTFTVSAAYLSNNITVAVSGTDAAKFGLSTTSITISEGGVENAEVTITPVTTEVGTFEATITVDDGEEGAAAKSFGVMIEVLETYTAKWIVNGDTEHPYWTQTAAAGTALEVPADPTTLAEACSELVFRGWLTSELTEASTTAPEGLITETEGLTMPADDINYYAVFAEKEGDDVPAGYSMSTSAPANGDKVIITLLYDEKYYAMTSSQTPGTSELTIVDGMVSEPANNIQWDLASADYGLYVYPAGQTTNCLHMNSSALKVASGTTNGDIVFSANGNGSFKAARYNSENPDRWIVGTNSFGCSDTEDDALALYIFKYSAGSSATYSNYVTSCPSCTTLPALSNVEVSNITHEGATFNWDYDAIANADGYYLEVALYDNPTYTKAEIGGLKKGQLPYGVYNLEAGTRYVYKVRAFSNDEVNYCDNGWGETYEGDFTTAPYYITGSFNEWTMTPMTADSFVFENLAAGTYEIKVSIDGTFDDGKVKGFTDLTPDEMVAGLYSGTNDNIVFTLAKAGKVVVTYNQREFKVVGEFEAQSVELAGNWDWDSHVQAELSDDRKSATAKKTFNKDEWVTFKMVVDSKWMGTSGDEDYKLTRDDNSVSGLYADGKNQYFQADKTGEYEFTWTFGTNAVTVKFPDHTYTVAWSLAAGPDETLGELERQFDPEGDPTDSYTLTMLKDVLQTGTFNVKVFEDDATTPIATTTLNIAKVAKYELSFLFYYDGAESTVDASATYQGLPTGVDNTGDGLKAVKMMKDNTIYIIRGDKTYTITGQVVK